jgi:hypothetical protein
MPGLISNTFGPNIETQFDWRSLVDSRTKRLPGEAYKLEGERFGLDVSFSDDVEFDEGKMAIWIPIADGNRRDGVGDLLEVGGIRTERHARNPIVGFDHFKTVSLPIGMAAVWDEAANRYDFSQYTFKPDPVTQTAKLQCFFYRGKGLANVDRKVEYDHALLCEQYFDVACKRLVQAGSIGYQVISARELPPDYEKGTPKGLHLLSILMLEGSLVVMPANQDTVMKMLSMPTCCGKPLSPYLIKSLEPYAVEPKASLLLNAVPLPSQQETTNRDWAGNAAQDGISPNAVLESAPGMSDRLRTRSGNVQGNPSEPWNTYSDSNAAGVTNRRIYLKRIRRSLRKGTKAIGPNSAMFNRMDEFATIYDIQDAIERVNRLIQQYRSEGDDSGQKAYIREMRQRIAKLKEEIKRRKQEGQQKSISESYVNNHEDIPVPHDEETQVPPATWRPGAGAVKKIREDLRGESKSWTKTIAINRSLIAKAKKAASSKGVELIEVGNFGEDEVKIQLSGNEYATKDVVSKILRWQEDLDSKSFQTKSLSSRDLNELKQKAEAAGLHVQMEGNQFGVFDDSGKMVGVCQRPYQDLCTMLLNDVIKREGRKSLSRNSIRRKTVNEKCPQCNGSGYIGNERKGFRICPVCRGAGEKPVRVNTSQMTLRKQFRTAKDMRRRLRKSKPGASLVFIDRKDMNEAEEAAEKCGLKFHHVGSMRKGIEKVKLMGQDESIDNFAVKFGRPIKGMMGAKSLTIETKDILGVWSTHPSTWDQSIIDEVKREVQTLSKPELLKIASGMGMNFSGSANTIGSKITHSIEDRWGS